MFVYAVFLAAIFIVIKVHFQPKVSAQTVIKREKGKDNEQKILTEIRHAKNFIANQKWEKASLKLTEIIRDFPQNQHLDVVYYWLGYSLFQQKHFFEAEKTIAVLQRQFPASAWLDEAKSLSVEISSKTGRQTNVPDRDFSLSDDETKAFTIQNLLETDRSQGILKVNEILNPASEATDNLKESILILLFDDNSDWATDKFIEIIKTEKNENILKQALIGLKKRDEKKILPVLYAFLEQNTNENLLDAAFYSVSGFSNETANKTLIYFAQNGGNSELKQKSIIWLGNIGSKTAIENLRLLYGVLTEIELKQQVQISLSEINSSDSLQVLINLIEVETDKELIEHGLEILKHKKSPIVLRYLEKKSRINN